MHIIVLPFFSFHLSPGIYIKLTCLNASFRRLFGCYIYEGTRMRNGFCNPYIKKDSPESEIYVDSLAKCLEEISKYATPKQIRQLKRDLQLDSGSFDEAKYIQAACETSVAASIAYSYPDSFQYEPKLNPPTNFDCAFEAGGFKFNLEVKCPDYSMAVAQRSRDCFSIGAFGRMDDFPSLTSSLHEIFASGDKPLEVQQHMDNKLKDFLLSTHKKSSPAAGENELNVLVVCCDDPMDMQKWFYYMFGEQGLLTPKSFEPPKNYARVDTVILTNLYHRHFSYKAKKVIRNHWDWSESFNLIFKNRSLPNIKDDAIWKLVDILPNYSLEILNYDFEDIDKCFAIPAYVLKELLPKGKRHFEL